MSAASVVWPAILHYRGQAELAYLKDEVAWAEEARQHGGRFREGDLLIDSSGRTHTLPHAGAPQFTGRIARMEEVVELIRAHAAHGSRSCASKLAAHSIAEAIRMVEALD